MAKPLFFFSAVSSFYNDLDEYGVQGFHELISYFEFREQSKKWGGFDHFHKLRPKRGEFLIDSGAFSAANRKKPIPIPEFIAWHKELEKECPYIKYKAGLDDLESWELTISNQEATDAAGLKLFPTYHYMDPPKVYDWILDRDYDLIGYGGLVHKALTGVEDIRNWLDQAYPRIVDSEGRKTKDTHLFGVANFDLLTQYPCFSGDSASALFKGGYGLCFFPRMNAYTGKRDFSRSMITIPVSEDAHTQGQDNAHYNTLKKGLQEELAAFVASESIPGFRPFTIQDLITRHQSRKVWNVWMMMHQTKFYPDDCRFRKTSQANQELGSFF